MMSNAKTAYLARAVRPVGERERDEYDRFGPWVMRIASPAGLPPAFDRYGPEVAASSIAVKLPFSVDRRDALAGSDLYERVLAVKDASLLVFDLEGGEARRRELRSEGIAALALFREILEARLIIQVAGGEGLVVRYNAVSMPLMQEVVDEIRRKGKGRAAALAVLGHDLCPPPSAENTFFRNLYQDQSAREPSMSLLVFQPDARLGFGNGTGIPARYRALAAIRPLVFPSSMILELPDEILLIREGERPRVRSRRGYRYEHLWIRKDRLEEARIEERQARLALTYSALLIRAGGHLHELALAAEPAAALDRLVALPGGRA
jgi:hypothetical protein